MPSTIAASSPTYLRPWAEKCPRCTDPRPTPRPADLVRCSPQGARDFATARYDIYPRAPFASWWPRIRAAGSRCQFLAIDLGDRQRLPVCGNEIGRLAVAASLWQTNRATVT